VSTRRGVVIGCGVIGAKRAEGLAAEVEAIELYDPDVARAAELARLLPVPAVVHADAFSALAAAGPDALAVIATTHDALAPNAIAAVEAGCHVMIEKPGARRVHELEPVVKEADRKGLTIRVGFNLRFHPAVLETRRMLNDGDLGPVLVVRGRYGHGGRLGYEREWRGDPERAGGGELLDQGVHLLDLTRHLTGDISLRYGAVSTRFWPMGVEDNAFVHLALASGGDGWLHASWTEWKNIFSLEITCRDTKLELSGLGGSYGPERLTVYRMPPEMGPPTMTTTEWPPGDTSWQLELDDFIGAVSGKTSVGATGEDALAVLRVVETIYAG
jgi:predicted dehydrogenase